MYSTSQFRLAAFQVLRSCLWGAAATGNRAAQSTECHAFQWWMQRPPFAPATTIELQWAFLHMHCYRPSWGLLWDKHPETGLLGHRGTMNIVNLTTPRSVSRVLATLHTVHKIAHFPIFSPKPNSILLSHFFPIFCRSNRYKMISMLF